MMTDDKVRRVYFSINGSHPHLPPYWCGDDPNGTHALVPWEVHERLIETIKEAYYEGWEECDTTYEEGSDNGADEDWETSESRRIFIDIGGRG